VISALGAQFKLPVYFCQECCPAGTYEDSIGPHAGHFKAEDQLVSLSGYTATQARRSLSKRNYPPALCHGEGRANRLCDSRYC